MPHTPRKIFAFGVYNFSVNDFFDHNFHITSIIKYVNHMIRLLEPEALDTSGVTEIAEPRPVYMSNPTLSLFL
jgi:hypothetical protein